ncbi:MAG: hypothetical protein K0S47_421 [Herbinix sp.]|jgi:hypothetical protein|nr:hypothetical protein [Herbinix sp.]
MIEVTALIYLCRQNASIAVKRGKKPKGYMILTMVFLLGFELLFAVIGVFLSIGLGTYLFALSGASLGAILSTFVTMGLEDSEGINDKLKEKTKKVNNNNKSHKEEKTRTQNKTKAKKNEKAATATKERDSSTFTGSENRTTTEDRVNNIRNSMDSNLLNQSEYHADERMEHSTESMLERDFDRNPNRNLDRNPDRDLERAKSKEKHRNLKEEHEQTVVFDVIEPEVSKECRVWVFTCYDYKRAEETLYQQDDYFYSKEYAIKTVRTVFTLPLEQEIDCILPQEWDPPAIKSNGNSFQMNSRVLYNQIGKFLYGKGYQNVNIQQAINLSITIPVPGIGVLLIFVDMRKYVPNIR